MPPLTAADYLALATGAGQIVSNVAAGAGRGADRAIEAEKLRREQENLAYERERAARAAQQQWLLTQLSQQSGRATDLADRSPLGAEQQFVQRQKVIGNALASLGSQPESSVYGGVVNPAKGLNLAAWQDPATIASLAERRKTLAGIEPNFQFGSMGQFGVGGPSLASAEEQVARYARDTASQRMAQELAMANMLNAQFTDASKLRQDQQAAATQAAVAPEKKGGFWSKLGKIALTAAPIIAAPFTGGATLAAIGALSGAGAGALGGGGLKGALMGGALGAIPVGGFGGGAATAAKGAGEAVKEVAKKTALSKIQQAVLNPAAIAKLVGAGMGGAGGAAVQGLSTMLPTTPFFGQRPGLSPELAKMAQAPAQMLPMRLGPVTVPGEFGPVTFDPTRAGQAPFADYSPYSAANALSNWTLTQYPNATAIESLSNPTVQAAIAPRPQRVPAKAPTPKPLTRAQKSRNRTLPAHLRMPDPEASAPLRVPPGMPIFEDDAPPERFEVPLSRINQSILRGF